MVDVAALVRRAHELARERGEAADRLNVALRKAEDALRVRSPDLALRLVLLPDSAYVLAWDGGRLTIDGRPLLNEPLAVRVEAARFLARMIDG